MFDKCIYNFYGNSLNILFIFRIVLTTHINNVIILNMNPLLRLLAPSHPDIFGATDYEITTSSIFHLLSLRKKYIFINGIGLCMIDSFDVCDVCKSSGNYIFPHWEKLTVLSKIKLSITDPITKEVLIKYYDRTSSNMKSLINIKIKHWIKTHIIFKRTTATTLAVV